MKMAIVSLAKKKAINFAFYLCIDTAYQHIDDDNIHIFIDAVNILTLVSYYTTTHIMMIVTA